MKWIKLVSLILCSSLLLAACNESVQDQVDEAISKIDTAIKEEPLETTVEEGSISLYLPENYVIDPTDEENNFLITSTKDEYLLFVNETDDEVAKREFDTLSERKDEQVIQLHSFDEDGVFGYIVVKQFDEKRSELIVRIGSAKLTSITSNKKVDEKLLNMVEIARSVEFMK